MRGLSSGRFRKHLLVTLVLASSAAWATEKPV